MARITAGVATSHVPAIGAALDNGRSGEPYWKPLFAGYDFSKQWIARQKPDVVVLVYNDHASAFSLDIVPTFAIGCAASFRPADEGWGPRPVPVVEGHPELASHIAQSVIQQDFDLTIINNMDVDHGLTVPMSLLFGQPQRWPVRVIPLAVNVVLFPPPSGRRCLELGRAIRRAVGTFDEDLNVQVWGWGDCDPAGIVYFPRYLEIFDACTAAAFEAVGLPKHVLLQTFGIIGIPMVDLRATFKASCTFGDDVVIDTEMRDWKRSSFKVHHLLQRDGIVAAEAFEVRVWTVRDSTDRSQLHSAQIPADVIALFS